ncbi:MAG: hypothetical protein C4334_07405 [Pyrinomonas sp.]|uniref:acyl-CoA dehydrogenase family protein n=1 Tax=Pyrinomonas sp. TaxID=2080306 RepID=UPI00331D453E
MSFQFPETFSEDHERLARSLARFVAAEIEPHAADMTECRDVARLLAQADLLRYAVALPMPPLDVRALCIVREALARSSPLADYVFTTQGMACYPLALAAPDHIRDFWLSRVTSGRAVAAISWPRGMTPNASRVDDVYLLRGTAPFTLNAGLADFYLIFARDEQEALLSLVIGARMVGLVIAKNQQMEAGYPVADIEFDGLRAPVEEMIGEPGDGERLLLATANAFRLSHAAAACGMAQRALAEATACGLRGERAGRLEAELRAARLLLYEAAQRRDTKPEEAALDQYATDFVIEIAHRVMVEATAADIGSLAASHVIARLRRGLFALRLLM